MTMRPAVFIDCDGTLNEDPGSPADFRQVHIYTDAFEAVRLLRAAGFAAARWIIEQRRPSGHGPV